MIYSRPTLHPRLVGQADRRRRIARRLAAIGAARGRSLTAALAPAPADEPIVVPLTAVSQDGGFNASIEARWRGEAAAPFIPLLVDSGNSALVLPDFAALARTPGFEANYEVLRRDATEPFGCPAAIVRGPIELPTTSAGVHVIEDCVFFACTADKPHRARDDPKRTCNFGLGCVSPWPLFDGLTVQAPLACDAARPFAEIDYSPGPALLAAGDQPSITHGSTLTLFRKLPGGFNMFDIVRDKTWMALTPRALTIGGAVTAWPSPTRAAIAMIDTGGGPLFLSDPDGFLYDRVWPTPASNPGWTDCGSVSCESVRDRLSVTLGDKAGAFTYGVDPARLPAGLRALTLVMCRKCSFMMEEYGMNIGGLSALFLRILIDYAGKRVGLQEKQPIVAQTLGRERLKWSSQPAE